MSVVASLLPNTTNIVMLVAPTLSVVVASWLGRRKLNTISTKQKENGETIGDIHVLVNSRLTKALERIDELEKLLRKRYDADP